MPQADIRTVDPPAGSHADAPGEAPQKRFFTGSGASSRRFRLLQFAFDGLALAAAWHATLELRLELNRWMEVSFRREQLMELAPPLAGVLALWLAVAAYREAARPQTARTAAASLARVAESALLAGGLVVVATFFFREAGGELSRSFAVLFVPVSLATLTLGRYGTLLAAAGLDRRWPARERVAVVGSGQQARRLAELLKQTPGGPWVSGVVLAGGKASAGAQNGFQVLGGTAELGALINRFELDRLVFADGELPQEELDRCASVARRMSVVASRALGRFGPDVRVAVNDLGGLALVDLSPAGAAPSQQLLKRAFDVAASAALLVALAPLLGALALAVKLSSPGPVLYKAPRVGKGGRHFTFLKFRSMYHGSNGRGAVAAANEKGGHLFKIRRDPRLTPLGRWMRRYSLDELPQLFNVLAGRMSLVGPRPLPAEDLDPDGQSRRFARWAEERSKVLPGITGLWQVSGRSRLPFERMVELDLDYVRNWSLALDFKILLETPLVVFSGDGAY